MLNEKVIYMDLPLTVKGMIVKVFDENGGDDYTTIVINSRYNLEQNVEAYEHELSHYTARDFEKVDSAVSGIEWERHRIG